jgi:hypothetical protein
MSSSPVCTCGVCPAHSPSGHGADHPGGAGWAGPVRRYLESVVEWLDGPEAMGAGHGQLEAPGSRSTRGSSIGCCCRGIWMSVPGWSCAAAG